jgi:hypothetical protein
MKKSVLIKHFKSFTLISIIFTLINLSSCKKEEVDDRDQYVGTWNYQETGALTLYSNGQSIGTLPIDDNGSLEITKTGSSDLMIDGTLCTLSGSNIIVPAETATSSEDGFTLILTLTGSGVLSSSIITLNFSYTGTWNSDNGMSGNLSGSTTMSLTK